MTTSIANRPDGVGGDSFRDAIGAPGAVVVFERVERASQAPKDGPALSNAKGVIGLSALLQKCGRSEDSEWESVTMADIKKAMVDIGIGRATNQIDFWSNDSRKLLDDGLTFPHYIQAVWVKTASTTKSIRVIYELRKGFDEQTVQEVYKSGNFTIKFVQVQGKTGDGEVGVGSMLIMKSPPKGKSHDGLRGFDEIKAWVLSSFRTSIDTMSQLARKHQFCLRDGTPVADTMTFKHYVDMLDESCPFDVNVPSINLRFKDVDSAFNGGDAAKAALAAMALSPPTQIEAPAALVAAASATGFMERNPSKIMEMAKIEMSTNASSPASLDEAAWSRVMKNCNVMHGWYLDRQTNQIKMAPKPAFALKTGLNLHLPEREHKPVDRNSDRCCAPDAIPNYFVNDGSKIDIIVVEDDMRSSMVRNNFEKSSVDAKTGGGYAGLGIGVTAGSSREIQKGTKKEKKKFAQKMIGQYMLPRVTLILNPDDLIVTDEAKEAATEIYDKRDGALIRKFHQRFGEFFSHEVIIGGMLTSTKTWEGSETIKDEKKKEDFKQTIGLAVTAPVDIGLESKSDKTVGQDESSTVASRDTTDRVVFEAVGGNTILASNPQQWCATVGNHDNWRVIERAELKRLIESIADSASRDMEDIVKWFSREVPPPVSQFMQIPPLRDAFVQLRLKNMTSDDKYQYLVYQHHKKPTSIKITSNPSIVPKNFRGPRVISYDDTWGPQDGIWVIKHRDDGDLVDGSRVTIRTIDFEHRFLSVLRTSEYFFTPCITTSGHEPVWRVRFLEDHTKPLPQTKSMKGLPVKENGRFCLTYEFADNPYGFRDFTKDERGFSERVAPRTGCGRLVLVRPSGTAQGWEDRTVFLLDTEGRDAEGTVRVDGNTDVKVTAAMFYLDILASDGSDREKDILIPENTENTEEDAMKMMRVKTEPAPHVNGRH